MAEDVEEPADHRRVVVVTPVGDQAPLQEEGLVAGHRKGGGEPELEQQRQGEGDEEDAAGIGDRGAAGK